MEAEQDEYSFMKEMLIWWAARDGEERGKVEEWGALLPATFAELREMGQNEWNAMMERVSGMGEEKLAEKLGALQMDGMRG